MEAWQEKMAELADQAEWQAKAGGACGWCTDEGERRTDWKGLHPVMNRFAEDRPAVFEYSRLDALDVIRAGYLGEYAAADANSRSMKLQAKVADFLANPASAKDAGVVVVVDVPTNRLGSAEFFTRRKIGADQLMETGDYATMRDAELEWMKRQATHDTGYARDDPRPSRKKKWRDRYRALCNRDRKLKPAESKATESAATKPLPA